jgi:serine/threonine-protein kinase
VPGSRLQAEGAVNLVVEAEPTTVPELSGMPVAEAARRLAAARLRTGEVRLEITGARPPGEVLRQQPEPQREVPVDSEVDLWVEAPSVVVPAFVGLDPQRVAALLRQAGLRARTDSRLVEGVADGVVLDQRPGAGARVAPGTMVALVVAERGVRVPNLVGSSRRVLERTLSGRELAIGRDASRPERASPGTIVEQSPAAGTLVRPGTPVHVTVATHCSVPDVRRMSREAALEALSRAKLTGRIGHVGEYRQNEVTGQEPRPGNTVECGSVVTISLGVDRGYS